MSPWFKRPISRKSEAAEIHPTGAALIDAAAGSTEDDVALLQRVAFTVAEATRKGDDHALTALAALLTRASGMRVSDAGVLVNILSALQFASMLPEEARADWLPPRHAVARLVEVALNSDDAIREQGEDLLWELVSTQLVADWLGRQAGSRVVAHLGSSELQGELERQLPRHESLPGVVAEEDVYPSVPA
jgi:hypothetical protein